MKIRKIIYTLLLVLPLLAACTGDDTSGSPVVNPTVNTYRVLMLCDGGEKTHWQRTAQWAIENMDKAQQSLPSRVKLELEWIDQADAGLESRLSSLTDSKDVVAVVGPTLPKYADMVATALNKKGILMITPNVTEVEFQRKWSGKDFVWNMAESDLGQLEILLSLISAYYPDSRVSLLTHDDNEAGARKNSFSDWLSFMATEMGLEVDDVYLYKDEASLRNYCRASATMADRDNAVTLIFAPETHEDALIYDDEWANMNEEKEVFEEDDMYYVLPLCTDVFYSPDVVSKLKTTYPFYQALSLDALPESGFRLAYEERFSSDASGDNQLMSGEAHLYDALTLLSYALTRQEASGETLTEAMKSVVDGKAAQGRSWLPSDATENYRQLRAGVCPDIDGVSSKWDFDKATHANVSGSTFRLLERTGGTKFMTLEYITTQGTKRSSGAQNMWNWTASIYQDFDEGSENVPSYPALDQRWALLVAASCGWDNYRFGADVFAMYQLLRRHGYDDEHIIMVNEDDLAHNAKNTQPGVLRVTAGGPNVWAEGAVDYHTSQLTAQDYRDILCGRSSERLPHVMKADSDDNVFVFWSGHGHIGYLDYGEDGQMDYNTLKGIIAQARDEGHFRKMFVGVEACYSGGLGMVCEGIPGVILMTAASPTEPSKAAEWDDATGQYLSNGFTQGFSAAITNEPDITMRDLYYTLMQHTAGSHVMVYNTKYFGSIYQNRMGEFFTGK